ncbi:MAG: DUF389 domain-containing protein [Flavobacteriaceae bacterium]|nr:DUF389 domain-containing protein [Bacteroidia bacterium]NNL62077.1 DUF389 domain-containing protein [Flavobacteriaceae bacterium]
MDNNQESKFNFEEEQEQKVEQAKEEVKEDAKGLIKSSNVFLKEIFSFRKDTDRDATIEAIKNDIPFKGATAWILICSIFVASVGLNANSTAVVIGAMLISPLMGPILGIGMAIAINDIDTLKRSLINFLVMVVLSVLTAYLFFEFFPLREDSSELLARTAPDIRDVLIAFFGGLALIIARTKKGTIASVIFGVAIATALMPPLCTVGYGLAKAGSVGFKYAGGAMYLFMINSIFIALATFLVLKVLRFPMLKYANSKKRRNIARFAAFVAVVAMIPAGYTFIDVLSKSNKNRDYRNFVRKEVNSNPNLWLQRDSLNFQAKRVSLYFNGEVPDATRADLINELKGYKYLADFSLSINANESRSADQLSKSLDRAYADLDKKDNIIDGLQSQIEGLQTTITGLNEQLENIALQQNKNAISFSELAKDAKIRFIDLQYFGYANMLGSKDFIKVDTIVVANVKWNPSLNDSLVNIKETELSNWLKQRLNKKEIVIKRE